MMRMHHSESSVLLLVQRPCGATPVDNAKQLWLVSKQSFLKYFEDDPAQRQRRFVHPWPVCRSMGNGAGGWSRIPTASGWKRPRP